MYFILEKNVTGKLINITYFWGLRVVINMVLLCCFGKRVFNEDFVLFIDL